ncbi:MAG TPA: DNA repair protein RecN [Candidatus Binatia bacterium]|jgi:DNA repair protein RecN (Recombination protein N)
MLRELQIKNFAVIDQAALELGSGLNVLTGETGAGKSIILNALGLISGGRASSDLIRHEEEEATVEAMFDDVPQDVKQKLQEAGYGINDELIIRRVVNRTGKNRIYVSGSLCPLNLLSDIGPALVHIYGQHEHQTLLKPETHLGLLDAFGGIAGEAEAMSKKFYALVAATQGLQKARENLEKARKQEALLAAQVEEIARARLRPDEEEELQVKKNVLMHAEKLYQGSLEGEELLYEGENALVSRLARYGSKLRELATIDDGLQPAVALLESALAQLEEANVELRRYSERVHFEPGALEQVEDRLAEIHRLKRKYSGSVEEILAMQAEAVRELQSIDSSEEEIAALERSFETARQAAWETASQLSVKRQRVAKRFKKEMEKEAKQLGMPDTVFDVHFFDLDDAEDDPPFVLGGKKLGSQGSDQIEFYFSPNRGEPPKPLARVASGGELSRLMLAIKSLSLTAGDSLTLLFDEVDAGIGGSVAEIVGKKLRKVAAVHQILCVTHLPQIAALADSHHIVRKEVVKDRTSTTVDKLKDGERIEEVARMLGGIKISERARRHAEEMVRGR